ncbi:MAG: SigF/SigG family RNA polymerase sporulation sigma factor [Lachnospiraceae bacterium]
MDQTLELLKLAKEGQKAAKETLVLENRGLVWSVVKRFQNRGLESEDLFQIGCIGLLKCIDKFDLSYGVKFSTYAVPMISGEIKRFLRDDGMVKVSRTLKELAYRAYQCQEKLQEKWGREPSITEIAKEIGVECEELALALDANSEVESLYQPIYQKEGQEILLMDKLEEEDNEENLVNRLFLEKVLSELEKEDRELIYKRYFEDKTQSAIAKELGVSQVQISRREKKILNQIREKI